jgi:nucleotide-binding universal stress UspA family protein
MIVKALFATDLGMFGPYMLRKVVSLAQQGSVVVDILHVIEPMGVFAESILETYLPEEDKATLRRSGIEAVIQGIKSNVEDSIRAEFIGYQPHLACIGNILVERGEPAEVICNTAITRQSELIIIGNHSQNSRQISAIGAVAVKVLQLSSIPVLMIPIQGLIADKSFLR